MLLALFSVQPCVQGRVDLADDEANELVLGKDVVDNARVLESGLHIARPQGLHQRVQLLKVDRLVGGLEIGGGVIFDRLTTGSRKVDRVVKQQDGLVIERYVDQAHLKTTTNKLRHQQQVGRVWRSGN